MNDFINEQDRELLERHGLASFDALWALQMEAIDAPNTERGGWSSVCRLELEGRTYYLKRQSNHLTRSQGHPLGEPTFAYEFRNIQRYQRLGIPALSAAFFAQRKGGGEKRAILLTHALDGWQDLQHWLNDWDQHLETQRAAILKACGELARCLHKGRQRHGCFYPKHIFLRPRDERFEACLIDLEKTRPMLFGDRDRVKDLEPLLRRAPCWGESEVRQFLSAYLGEGGNVERWLRHLGSRRKHKEIRH